MSDLRTTTTAEALALGTVGSGALAHVGAHGGLTVSGEGWSLQWWVVAEDRIHDVTTDAAVRQARLDETPVVDTSMRVPGGDVIGRAYAAVPAGQNGAASICLELENASPVPVAVVVVVGPTGATVDGDHLVIGDRVMTLSRSVARWVVGGSSEELSALVGADVVSDSGEADDPSTAAPAAGHVTGFIGAVVPLPHTQLVRTVISPPPGVQDPSAVPAAAQVASGWASQVDRGTAIDWPEGDAASAWLRDRPRLLMCDGPFGVDGAADRLGALIRCGWLDEASAATDALLVAQRGRGSFRSDDPIVTAIDALAGFASWNRAGVPAASLEHLVGPVATTSHWLERQYRKGRVPVTLVGRLANVLAAGARFLEWAGQPDAASGLGRLASSITVPADDGSQPERPQSATPGATISALVDQVVDEADGRLELFAGWRDDWAGHGWEVADAPTRWGVLSFAVRWHDARPALLWELAPWPDVAKSSRPALEIRASAIDPAWSTTDARGDALLAAP